MHDETGHILIPDMLRTLTEQGIRSLMVEGGATVIRSFLSAAGPGAAADGVHAPGLVDAVIVTVAPVFVGADGVGYGECILGSQVSSMWQVLANMHSSLLISLPTRFRGCSTSRPSCLDAMR